MKRTITILAMFAACSAALYAQDLYSAADLGENLYYGTARTIGMGNAVTAVGGDLGSVTINPAGSAVCTYSQVELSPGLSISSTYSAYAPTFRPANGLRNADFGAEFHNSRTRFVLPSGGVNMFFSTGRDKGLVGMSFGIVSNNTNSYVDYSAVNGLNEHSTMTGSMAYLADGVPSSAYLDANAYNNYDLNYFAVMAVGSGMAQPLSANTYYGAAEVMQGGYLTIPGRLAQSSSVRKAGSKNDFAINLGFNVSNRWYFGANLGIPMGNLAYNETFSELADSDKFEYFRSARYGYTLNRSVSGIYGKFGFIGLPAPGLRIGFTIQTPTSLTVNDRYSLDGYTSFKQSKDGSDGGDRSNSYKLRTPYRIGAGLAYTFRGKVLVSADYEMADFSITRFRSFNNGYLFDMENASNRLFLGCSHNFRAGVEYKIAQLFAIRAGYNLLSDPVCHYEYGDGNSFYAEDFDSYAYEKYIAGMLPFGTKKASGLFKHSYSLGLGFSSRGSFFADLATRLTTCPSQDFVPYPDYIFDTEGYVDTPTPTVRSRRNLWDVVLTIGFRF